MFQQVISNYGEARSTDESAYSAVPPGFGTRAADVADGLPMVIGPEKQFVAWEEYLKTVEGADARLYRLYPRGFWITAAGV